MQLIAHGLDLHYATTNDETTVSQYKVDVLLHLLYVDIAIGRLVDLGMLVCDETSRFGESLCDLVRGKLESWLALGGVFVRFNVGYS